MPSENYEDAEVEAMIEWKQAVACADAYREQRRRELTAAAPANTTGQSGATGTGAAETGVAFPPTGIGSEPQR